MKYFEDLAIGERTLFGSHTFAADEIKAFAARYDPQLFHLDEAAAARSHFGALCASGWHTAAVCMRLLVDCRRREDEASRVRGEPVAQTGPSPGVRDLKWLKPVHVGDTITYQGEIVALRALASRPQWGLMTGLNSGTNQRRELVVSFWARCWSNAAQVRSKQMVPICRINARAGGPEKRVRRRGERAGACRKAGRYGSSRALRPYCTPCRWFLTSW
jgi:acyl dehydratase